MESWKKHLRGERNLILTVFVEIWDVEVMINGEGFTQPSGTAWMETQGLYYEEMKIIIGCDKLMKGMT